MTTPEQQARDMVDRMGFAVDFTKLANLIEERDRLRENENLFRRLLADRSGLQFVSRDNGGLQAEANCIDFDFLRDTPQELQRKFHSLVVSRLTSSGPNAGRVKPLQEKTELDRLRDVLKKANDQAERFEREWYLRGDELDRLRAGIEAALVEIELQRQDPGAFDYPATIAWEQASDAAAEIVRKHTGVTK